MSAIFISHSSRDNHVADEIRAWLARLGHRSVFLDFDPAIGIPAGRDWEQELYRNIRACRAVIVLCSRHSMASRWCFMEITHARALGKHLFPVKIDDCDVDGVLTDRQVIDLTGDQEEAFRRLEHGILASGLDPANAFDWDGSRPPYPGLLAFQEEDAAIFFGREDEVGEGLDLVNRVRRLGQSRLVMVLGASGTGKSSLVRAGLLPRLRRDIERWLVIDPFRPRDDPAGELAAVLSRAFDRLGRTLPAERIADRIRAAMDRAPGDDVEPETDEETRAARQARAAPLLEKLEELEAALPNGPDARTERYLRLLRAAVLQQEEIPTIRGGERTPSGADDLSEDLLAAPDPDDELGVLSALADDLRRHGGRNEACLLLAIDQFEELLGRGPDHPNSRFLRLLRAGFDRPDAPLLALGTMRSDFLEVFQKEPALLDVRYESLSLGPMAPEDVAQVIAKPAELAAIELEPGLVQALVDDAEKEKALPLLAFTLRELNERYGDDGLLTVREYRDELGGLHGAVAEAARGILRAARVDAAGLEQLRRAFMSLVRMTEDGAWARRIAHWDGLPEGAHPLLERLVQGRLLVAGSDAEGRTLEVAHEALFYSWDRLARWLDENAEALRLRQEIQSASRSWDEAGRSEDQLWRGGRLVRARELLEKGDLEPLGLEFVEASRRAAEAQIEAEKTRRKRLLHWAVGGFLVMAVLSIATIIGYFKATAAQEEALRQQRAAEEQSRIATSRQLAVQARLRLETEHDLALLLSLEAVRAAPTAEARGSLLKGLQVNPQLERIVYAGDDHVAALAFSPDSAHLATGSWHSSFKPARSGGVRLWSAQTGERIWTSEASFGRIGGLAFSPDGTRLAAGSCHPDGRSDCVDREIRMWDVATGDPIGTIVGQRWQTHVASRWDNPIIVWDVATGYLLDTPPVPGDVQAWSANGTRLATRGADGRITVWDARTGESRELVGAPHPKRTRLAFSADGERLAAGHRGGDLRLWEAGTGKSLTPPPGSPGVNSVALSADGGYLAWSRCSKRGEVCHTSEIHVWDVVAGILAHTLRDQPGESLVAFSPATGGDALLASGGCRERDASNLCLTSELRLWRVGPGDPFARPLAAPTPGPVCRGTRLDLSGPRPPEQCWPGDRFRPVITAGADGTLLAIRNEGGEKTIWEVTTGKRRATFSGDPGTLQALSPDGRRIAYTSDDELRVRDASSGDLIMTVPRTSQETNLGGEAWDIAVVAFSPDGTRLAFDADEEGTIEVWEIGGSESRPRMTLAGHTRSVASLAFSPDGRRLASGGRDNTVVIWNLTAERMQGEPLLGHEEWVFGVSFSPDGSILASGAPDGTVRLWDTATGESLGAPLRGGKVHSVAFTDGGRTLASAHCTKWVNHLCVLGAVTLWDVDPESWKSQACRIANRNLTQGEWRRFVGQNAPYRKTCEALPPPAGSFGVADDRESADDGSSADG